MLRLFSISIISRTQNCIFHCHPSIKEPDCLFKNHLNTEDLTDYKSCSSIRRIGDDLKRSTLCVTKIWLVSNNKAGGDSVKVRRD